MRTTTSKESIRYPPRAFLSAHKNATCFRESLCSHPVTTIKIKAGIEKFDKKNQTVVVNVLFNPGVGLHQPRMAETLMTALVGGGFGVSTTLADCGSAP